MSLRDVVGAVEATAIDTQSSAGVPRTQSRTWSRAALAAEAALEAPRASMIAAPRLATSGMNSFTTQASSSTASQALVLGAGVFEVRVLGVEWLPQLVIRVISLTGTELGGEL